MTDKLTRLVANCETGEVTEVEFTDAEQAEFDAMRAQMQTQIEAFEAEKAAKDAAKASAESKLKALGLSDAEIAALLN